MRANNSNFSFKGFEVASHTRAFHVQKREQKGTKNVHVLQKLDILFGLNTPPHPIVHTIYHLRQLGH
jgi:hypothetical protein